MADKKKPDNLEMEKIKLEKFKVWGKIITVLVSVVFGSALVAVLNHQIQKRQLAQQDLLNKANLELQDAKAKAERRQNEMKYLADLSSVIALEGKAVKRLRYADYFATLTISKELRKRWMDYRDGIIKTMNDLTEKKIELAKVQNKVKAMMISEEINQLQSSLSEMSEIHPTKDKAGLVENNKPLRYIENEYEIRSDGQVVYDKTTGLTWEQSGSAEMMSYRVAEEFIAKLCNDKFAGYNDWRLPTLKEAITLLEKEKSSSGLFIEHVFDSGQQWIWTSDQYGSSSAWVVDFGNGNCDFSDFLDNSSVRAVR